MSECTLFPSEIKNRTACIIVDSEYIRLWQYSALKLAMGKGLLINCVLRCNNTVVKKNFFKHFLYYVLNLVSMRHKWNKRIKWRALIGDEVPMRSFNSNWSGSWQSIPEDVSNFMQAFNFDFVIKFGMYLLKDPDKIPSKYGVFSYHHGDPSIYRGRPAGFYELLNNASSMGVMVQRLSNRLDSGQIFAFGQCKIFPYSYKKTLENAYGNGIHLLLKALVNAMNEDPIHRASGGENCKLPKNYTVCLFFSYLFFNKIKRLFYGVFIEKKWRVCVVDSLAIDWDRQNVRIQPTPPLAINRRYAFMADPIAYDDSIVFCEAMNKITANGVVVALTPTGEIEIDMSGFGSGHFSYPFVIETGCRKYLLPEMSRIGPQMIGLINNDLSITDISVLRGLEGHRLKDPTMFFLNDKWWLFAGKSSESSDLLFLWYSDNIRGPFFEHVDNPVVINQYCARPAGPVFNHKGSLFRLGQNNSASYGNGVTVSRITSLSELEYHEEVFSNIFMESASGPHTICIYGDKYVVDYYHEGLSGFALYFRLRGLINRILQRIWAS